MLSKKFAAIGLSVFMTGCATTKIQHVLTDECLQKAKDEDGKVLQIEFNRACGDHKRDLAVETIRARQETAIAIVQANVAAQTDIINAQKRSHLWRILATGMSGMDKTRQILTIHNAREKANPELIALANESQLALGITEAEIQEQVDKWELQAEPGRQLLRLNDGSIYMDVSDEPYGPFAHGNETAIPLQPGNE